MACLPVRYVAITVAMLVVLSCDETPPASHAAQDDNPVLALLYAQDQADRPEGLDLEALESMDWDAVAARDSNRRAHVERLVRVDSLFTANDYYRAAMIFQHGGDSTAYRMARDLSMEAMRIDTSHAAAKWLSAASQDRYLLSIGEPQWYGTQTLGLRGKWYLLKIDTTRVTDEERTAVGAQTLDEIRAMLTEANGEDLGYNMLPDSLFALIR